MTMLRLYASFWRMDRTPMIHWGGLYDDLELGVATLVGEKLSLEILHLMLQYGWNQKRSVMHIAAAEIGNTEALKLLVEHGADLEEASGWWPNCGIIEVDKWGTALYRTAYKGQREPVTYLLDKVANIWFKDDKGDPSCGQRSRRK